MQLQHLNTIKETCAYLRLSKTALYRAIDRGEFPPPTPISGKRFFKKEVLESIRNNGTEK